MPSQNKDDYLTKAEMMAWSRFLNSPEGQKGLLFLRLGCKRNAGEGDNTLIKNAVGFEYWQRCVDAVENLGEVPKRAEREPDESLEQ